MLRGIPITRYQANRLSFVLKSTLILIITVFVAGNIISAAMRESIKVERSQYLLKDGFPLFTNGRDFINLVKRYPYNPGVHLTLHTIGKNETFWDITRRYKVSIDTIIAANPFIKTLQAESGMEILVPLVDGVLLPYDNSSDISRMVEKTGHRGIVRGDQLNGIFEFISTDDIRFVFLENARPEVLNDSIEKLYSYKKVFQLPVNGFFTSLFGDRVDPFHHGMDFHDGIDIVARYGTPIKPAREGIVIYTGWRDGYGKTIMVQHYDGYTTLYGHCSKLVAKVGDWVTKKDVIAAIGSTGRSTGPHLHLLFMRHGETIDPINLIW
jgi:murein DD-endopeptidase MepM/ murein hydrolase activator NlpD